jgi:hypothetical protein
MARTNSAVRIVDSMANDHGGIDEIFVPTNNNNYVAVRFRSDKKVGVYVIESHIESIDSGPDERFSADKNPNGYHMLYWPGHGPDTAGTGSHGPTRPLCACHVPVTADGRCTFDACDGVVN